MKACPDFLGTVQIQTPQHAKVFDAQKGRVPKHGINPSFIFDPVQNGKAYDMNKHRKSEFDDS